LEKTEIEVENSTKNLRVLKLKMLKNLVVKWAPTLRGAKNFYCLYALEPIELVVMSHVFWL